MSSTVIAATIGLGVLILIMIAFINQKLEANRLEKERATADLNDRIKRCAQLSDGMPGQFMTVALKQLLNRVEVGLLERLGKIKSLAPSLEKRREALAGAIAKGDALETANAARPLHTEARVKELRAQLEVFHGLLAHANQVGIVDSAEAQSWVAEMHYTLTLSYVEFFRYQAERLLKDEQYIQARQSYERATQQIRKQKQPERYTALLAYLDEQIAHVKKLHQQANEQQTGNPNELADSVETLDDESWRKKNDYE